ncbi:MAG: Uma2 family endonuclease, partial [Planctomycetota bacterium]
MSALRRYRPVYTVTDYAAWEGDWELWDGAPVSMSPSPFGRHSAIVFRLAQQLSNAIEAERCGATVLGEIDWIVSETTVVRPDVLIVCGDPPERHVESPPAMVAEVFSEATRDRDQTFKRDLYRDEGVTHYLMLDPDTNVLTHGRFNA